MLPTFFIAGAQKSGTTSLHYLLSRHQDFFFPPKPQEIDYFGDERNFAKGVAWYESLFDTWSGQSIIAQTSASYINEPFVPARMHALVPEAKIVFILRNPVDRAYSHYWHGVKKGYEALSFETALAKETERVAKGTRHWRRYAYVGRGA